ncbi:MAG: response regulator [Proteobacteria bacterium]|nr:response regulator [Pseudomonadota bacterium]
MQKKILIIDDEHDLVTALVARFETVPDTLVATAYDAALGIRKARSWQPDAILMDIYMPGMDGWEATKQLMADGDTKEIPVVIMTAVLSKTLIDQANAAGAKRIITKPFEERDLRSLMSWLEDRVSRPPPEEPKA